MSTLDQKKQWIFLLLSVIIFTAFAKNITADFMLSDDGLNIYNNPYFKDISLNNVKIFWIKPYENLYIPIIYTAWAGIGLISKVLFDGFNPLPFHFANLIVHIGNSILVFCLIKTLSKQLVEIENSTDIIISACCAILFGIHPIQTEAVSWISGMKDLLSTFFSLCSIVVINNCMLSLENRKKIKLIDFKDGNEFSKSELSVQQKKNHFELEALKYFLASIFFLMALLSKPNTVIIPFIIIIEIAILKKSLKLIMIQMVPWIIFSLLLGIIANHFMNPGIESEKTIYFCQRLVVAFDSILFYIQKILWPHPLIYDYGRKIHDILDSKISYIIPFFCIFSAAVIWRLKDRVFFIGFTLMFIISILPYSGLMSFEFQRISTVADRYCYLGMAIFSVFVGLFIIKYLKYNKKIFILLSVLLTVLFFKTITQVNLWQNNIILNQYVLSKNKSSYIANLNLGIALAARGEFNEAIKYYKKSVDLAPLEEKDLPIYNLGIAYACIGQKDEVDKLIKKLETIQILRARALRKATSIIYEALKNKNAQ